MHQSGDLWVLYTCTWEWSKINFGLKVTPMERFNHTAVRCGDRMILYGGVNSSVVKSKVLADLWEFDIDSQEWKEIQKVGLYPSERHSHSATSVFEHLMLIFGGTSKDSKTNCLGDCWMLNTHTWVWNQVLLRCSVPNARFGHCMTNIGSGFVIIHAGFNGKFVKDTYVMDLRTRNCILVNLDQNDEYEERKCHSMTMMGTNVVFLGGAQNTKVYSDMYTMDCEKFKFKHLLPDAEESIKSLEYLLKIPTEIRNSSRSNNVSVRTTSVNSEIDFNEEHDRREKEKQMRMSIPRFSLDIEASNEKFFSSLLLNDLVKGGTFENVDVDNNKNIKKEIGRNYYRSGQFYKAIVFFNKFIDELYPKIDIEVIEGRGRSYYITGEYEKALVDFETMKDANRSDITFLKIDCLLSMEEYVRAVNLVEKSNLDQKDVFTRTLILHTQWCETTFEKLREATRVMNPTVKVQQDNKKMIQVYVSGSPGSGKTTYVQQLHILYKKSLSPKECANFRKSIQQEVLDNAKQILNIAKHLDIKFEIDRNSHLCLDKFDVIEPKLYEPLIILATDKACPIAFKSKDSCPEFGNLITQNAQYFFYHAERILCDDFAPIPTDVLYLSAKKTSRKDHHKDLHKFGIKHDSMQEFTVDSKEKSRTLKFRYREVDFHAKEVIIGTNPSVLSVKKETIIVFLVALDDLDKKKSEESQGRVDRFQYTEIVRISSNSAASIIDGCYQFDLMCNSEKLRDSTIILLFTKNSIFEKKHSNGVDLSQVFPDYRGGKNLKKTQEFIINIFKKLNGNKKRSIYPYFTDCVERKKVEISLGWIYDCLIAKQTKEYLKEQGML